MLLVHIAILLLLFQVKHFLCDYILQTTYHLGKFKESGWVKPLAHHCSIHVIGTIIIAIGFLSLTTTMSITQMAIYALFLGLFDFFIHFIMDRIKASPTLLGAYKPTQKEYWWSLGLDQSVHHITHYAIILIIVSMGTL